MGEAADFEFRFHQKQPNPSFSCAKKSSLNSQDSIDLGEWGVGDRLKIGPLLILVRSLKCFVYCNDMRCLCELPRLLFSLSLLLLMLDRYCC